MFQGDESSPCDHSTNHSLNASLQNSSSPPLFNARDQCKSLHERQHDIEGDTTALRHFQSCRRIQLFLHPGPGAVRVLLTFCADPSCIFPVRIFTRAIFIKRKITGSPEAPGKALIPILHCACVWGSPDRKQKTKQGEKKKS